MYTYNFEMDISPIDGISLAADVEVKLSGEYCPEDIEDPACFPEVDEVYVYVNGEPVHKILIGALADKTVGLATEYFMEHVFDEALVELGLV